MHEEQLERPLNLAEAVVQPEELLLVLEALHAEESFAIRDEATVGAICEATGASEHRIWRILEDIRHNDLESRLSQRLREIEEPLYRVERPSPGASPSGVEVLTARRRAFDGILDSLPRPAQKKAEKPTKLIETAHDRLAQWIATAVLILIVLSFAALLAYGMTQMYR